MGDILQFLGIDGKLSQELPMPFYVPQVLFAFLFLISFFDQIVFPQDPANGFMGTGQVVFPFQGFGPHKGILFPQPHHLLFEGWRSFMGAMEGDPRQFVQAAQAFLAVAGEPFPHGLSRGAERPGGGFDSLRPGIADHFQPQIEFIRLMFHSLADDMIFISNHRTLDDIYFLW